MTTDSLTYLVTGGAGFIGSNLVRHLMQQTTARIVNLDRLTYAGNLDSLQDVSQDVRHIFVEGDIGDRELVARLLSSYRPDAILHLAAESHVDRSIDGPLIFVETNMVGTAQLLVETLNYWRQLNAEERDRFRFLHVSTDEVYGSLGTEGRFVETTAYAPNSPYAASKAGADFLVRSFHHTYGLPSLITNCSNNYGPYQFPEKLIPLMIQHAVQGKELPVYGDGSNVRDWLYVVDHCRALQQVLERGRPGEVYNIGGDCEQTNLDVVRQICDLVDDFCPELPHAPCSSLIRFVPDRPGHDRRYAIDAGKMRREFEWKPREDFASGIRQTVRWYLDHSAWIEHILSGRYRLERLGLGPTA